MRKSIMAKNFMCPICIARGQERKQVWFEGESQLKVHLEDVHAEVNHMEVVALVASGMWLAENEKKRVKVG